MRRPTLKQLIQGRDDEAIRGFLDLATGKRPGEELFDLAADPGCLDNLADEPEYAELLKGLREELDRYLLETGDPRATGNGADLGRLCPVTPRFVGSRNPPGYDAAY